MADPIAPHGWQPATTYRLTACLHTGGATLYRATANSPRDVRRLLDSMQVEANTRGADIAATVQVMAGTNEGTVSTIVLRARHLKA